MKLTTLLIFTGVLNISAGVYSQDSQISVNLKNGTLSDLFNIIEKKTEYKIFYKTSLINEDQKIDLAVDQMPVSDLLTMAFTGKNLTYDMVDKVIVITPVEVVQQSRVTGTISDSNTGEALPGVSIQVEGTSVGTVSDVNGKYSIEVPPSGVLVFSYIGYITQRVTVSNQTVVDVKLVVDAQKLEEVVVIGYGSQKKTSITGAISSVSSKEITALPVANMQSALQGKATGVSVTNYGAPGNDPVVRVRGVGSISYASDPLYIIDGVPASNMSSINSRDIESVEVLKDAASTAIYGSRAANGVILITTKKGKRDGKISISVDSYVGTQSIIKTLDLLNTEQYIKYGTALNTASGDKIPSRFSNMNQPIYTGASQTFAQTNTDWQKALFHKAVITDNNISMSTGGEKSNFYASAGYFKQDGIMINTGFQRYSIRFNSDHQLSKRIKMGQTLLVSFGDRNNEKQQQGRTNIMHAIREAPYLPVYNPNNPGGYQAAVSGTDGQDAHNPIEIQNLFTSTTGTTKVFGTIYAEFKITDWLSFKSIAGVDYTNITNKVVSPIFNDGFNSNSSATVTRDNTINVGKTFTNQLTFDKSFGGHSFNVIAVQEQTPFSSNYMFVSGNLASNATTELTGLTNTTANGNIQRNTLVSYLGRINYDFKNKYLLSASFRADGSSKFATGNKWGYFKAGSIGWRLKEEDFLKSNDLISDLKLRGGYGEMGNNGGIGSYVWKATMSANTDYIFNNGTANGTFYNALSNPNLKWETSKMTNIGIDLGLLGNKVTFTAEWFTRTTDNLILAAQYDNSIGYRAPYFTNVGKMKNDGFEFQAAVQLNAGDLKSTLSGNISFVKNNVEALYSNSPIDAGFNQDYGAYNMTRTAVGHSIQSFYGWIVDGIIQNSSDPALAKQAGSAPGDIKFRDINNDGTINGDDRAFLGSYLPKATYSFTYSGTYKKFDFSAFFQGVYGNKLFNGTKVLTQGMLRLFNAGTEVMNAWTHEGQDTDVPRAISGDPNQNARASTRFIESGSYLRLKALTIGYTLPLSSLTKGNINQLRIYATAQNLLTFTKYTGYDPEVAAYFPNQASGLPGVPGGIDGTSTSGLLNNGVDYGLVPQPRTFLAGIQINF